MGNVDAEVQFFEAVDGFKLADNKARTGNLADMDAKVFRSLIIDLDAAIPGLTDDNLGRALLVKASCFHWLYLKGLKEKKSIFDVVNSGPDPLLAEGLSYATEGRKILEERGLVDELPWANSVVEKLGD